MSIQVTNFGNTLGLPAGYVEAITAIVTEEIKFCVQNPTTNGTTGQVPVFANPQLIQPTNVIIDNTNNLSVGGTVTIGNNAPATNYTLPATIGVPQQVLQVPTIGNVLEWANSGATVPTFLNTLVVDELSQGPNGLSKNYTFPQYPPPIDTILGNNGTQGFVVNIPATINCQFIGTYANPLRFSTINIPILAGDYIPDDLTNIISVALRDSLAANNVIANIFIGFDPLIQRYGMRLSPGTVDFTSMTWQIYVNGTNNNNVFGLTTGNATVTPAAPGVVYGPDAPLYLNATGELVWRSVAKNIIESDNGNSVIECSELSGIISYGDYNINNGSINNCGNINALDNCNITTGTTQIENGLGELNISINSLPRITQNAIKSKLECGTSRLQLAAVSDLLTDDTSTYFASQNALLTKNMAIAIAPDTLVINQDYGVVNRMVVDDTTTALYSKNALSGPTGSSLTLNNDSSFSLGTYFAGNGAVECSTNSMGLVGPQAKSTLVLTDATITKSLFNGTSTVVRETMDSMGQTFKDGNQVDRIKLDSTDVTINGAYTLPTTAGVDGEVLTRTTGISTTWNRPQVYSIFSQIVDQTVVNTAAETTIIGGGTPTSTLTVAPNFFTAGMAFRYTTGGLFRTSANNITARFRLRNSGVLFDSGLLVFSNRVITDTPWNVEATFAYMGGTVMVTNFNFQYNAGNDARGFTSQQSNNTFNATVSNTLNFTIQWGVASANNSITTNFGVVQKIY
jgi:hypothetical protein